MVSVCRLTFGRAQDVGVAESTDKHHSFEGFQAQGARTQVLHVHVPDLQTQMPLFLEEIKLNYHRSPLGSLVTKVDLLRASEISKHYNAQPKLKPKSALGPLARFTNTAH